MRFERWRGMPLVLAMAAVGLGLSWADRPGRMDIGSITRSRGKSAAYDFTTGGEFMAPPVPYGHYAKDGIRSAAWAAGCTGCWVASGAGTAMVAAMAQAVMPAAGAAAASARAAGYSITAREVATRAAASRAAAAASATITRPGKFAPCDSGAIVVDGGFVSGSYQAGTVVATTQSVPAGMAVVQPSGQCRAG